MSANYVDYFNPTEVTYNYVFPDGKTSLTFRKLKEADRAWLQDQRSVIEMDRKTQTMRMDGATGKMKMDLINRAMIEWDVRTKKGDEMTRVPFDTENRKRFLENLEPTLIDSIYLVIEENNPFLSGKETKNDKKK